MGQNSGLLTLCSQDLQRWDLLTMNCFFCGLNSLIDSACNSGCCNLWSNVVTEIKRKLCDPIHQNQLFLTSLMHT